MPSPRAVLVFAKPPRPGRVKTRLRGALSARQAAEVHRACLQDAVALVAAVAGCEKRLFVAASAQTARRLARKLKLSRRWRVGRQSGQDLGARLKHAFSSMFQSGHRKVVVVGTDTPWMGPQRVEQAFRLLAQADVVLGPTDDGGYYLVGARRLIPEMFRRIPWGTSRVFRSTLRALQRLRASYRLLPRDFDLDRPEDLLRAARLLRQKRIRAPALKRWIVNWEPDHPGAG